MNIPIQSQPVTRTSTAFVSMSAQGGVLPSGNCASNYWCCTGVNGAGPSCYPCHNALGVCGTPQATFCNKLGGSISDQCGPMSA